MPRAKTHHPSDRIVIQGAREHNLRDVSLDLPRDKLIVFTGLSGSGKSSLAFDTIYAEGQRRYVESLSSYARQFLGQMDKPDVDVIEGLSPAISIDQKSASRNPRSTVGTVTEIYDYLRLLYARIGIAARPRDGRGAGPPDAPADRRPDPAAARGHPLPGARPGRPWSQGHLRAGLRPTWPSQGFGRVRVDGEVHDLADAARARPLRAAHHRGHRRPARPARGHRAAAHRVDGDRAAPGRGRGPDRARAGQGRARGHRDRGADLLREARPSLRRQVLRGAGAPQLLVQLALRRLPGTATASAPCSRSIPSWSCPTPSSRSPTVRIAPWAGGHAKYFHRLLESICEAVRHRRLGPLRRSCRRRTRSSCSTASATPSASTVKFQNRYGRTRSYSAKYEGVIPYLKRRHAEAESDAARDADRGLHARGAVPRPASGARLNPLRAGGHGRRPQHLRAVQPVDRRGRPSGCATSSSTTVRPLIAERILKEIDARLRFLFDVGLDYLIAAPLRGHAVGRRGAAHPAGVADRLAAWSACCTCSTSRRSACTSATTTACIETLQRLRDLGNTVLVVEHDEDTIRVADHVVDIGPGAGEHGGARRALRHGRQALLKAESSITGQYLAGKRSIPVPEQRRAPSDEWLAHQGRPGAQPPEHRRRHPARLLRGRHRRVGLGQVDADQRHPHARR